MKLTLRTKGNTEKEGGLWEKRSQGVRGGHDPGEEGVRKLLLTSSGLLLLWDIYHHIYVMLKHECHHRVSPVGFIAIFKALNPRNSTRPRWWSWVISKTLLDHKYHLTYKIQQRHLQCPGGLLRQLVPSGLSDALPLKSSWWILTQAWLLLILTAVTPVMSNEWKAEYGYAGSRSNHCVKGQKENEWLNRPTTVLTACVDQVSCFAFC